MQANSKTRFGKRLKSIRQQRGITLRELDDATGVTYSYIALIEAARRGVGPAIASKLADGLKLEGTERNKFLLSAEKTSTPLGKMRVTSGCPAFLANIFSQHLKLLLRLDPAELESFGCIEKEAIFESQTRQQLWFACERNTKPGELKRATSNWIKSQKQSSDLLVVFFLGNGRQAVVRCEVKVFSDL